MPDHKGKLNTLLIATLPQSLDCSTRRRNFLPIVLLQMMGDGIGSMWLIYISVGEDIGSGYYIFCFFAWLFIFFSLVSFVFFCSDYSITAAVPVSVFLFCFLGLPYSTHHHQNSWWSLSFISLLISYPCSFCFYAFMLLALWEWKFPPLNEPGKN